MQLQEMHKPSDVARSKLCLVCLTLDPCSDQETQKKNYPSSPPIVVQITDLIGAMQPLLLSSEKKTRRKKEATQERRGKNKERKRFRAEH
jgi:hypothetical protein